MKPYNLTDFIEDNWDKDQMICIKWLFHVRVTARSDLRIDSYIEGLKLIYKKDKDFLKDFIEYIPHYGTWNDCLFLLDTELSDSVINLYGEALIMDVLQTGEYSDVSTNCPLPGSEIDKKYDFCYRLCASIGITKEDLVTDYLNPLIELTDPTRFLVETGKWKEIKYSEIPFNRLVKYKDDFMKHDKERFTKIVSRINRKPKIYKPRSLNLHYMSVIKINDLISKPSIREKNDMILVVDCSASCIGLPLAIASSLIDITGQKSWIPFSNTLREIATRRSHEGMLEEFNNLSTRVSISIKNLSSLYRDRTFLVITNRDPALTYYDFDVPLNKRIKLIHWNVSDKSAEMKDISEDILYISGYCRRIFKCISKYRVPPNCISYVRHECSKIQISRNP